MAGTWVYVQLTPEGPHASALELITKAREIDGEVSAIALGPGASSAAGELGSYGAGTVFASDDAIFVDHPGRPAAHTIKALAEQHSPSLILFPATYEGRDVAGRLQALTGSTLMGNATDVLAANAARTEIFGGTKLVDVELAGPDPKLVLVRPKSFPAEPSGGTAQIVQVDTSAAEAVRDARVVERHVEAASGPKLEEAKVVLAGGRGLGGPDGFGILEELATELGETAVGASRAAVDAGWVPYSYQIGQTGKTVKPEVYLAAGISGALQHVVGMKNAKRIVAINKDEEAPILRMADLGVVGDLFQVLPALAEEVKRRKAQ
jgi:electron transfer flavoprotein alpha subunit